ncbi:hypothetical protein NQ318_011232 [Aromia moschata]|uniref:Uncharacterized protein n=1 Tax=Aromia moschata TaxID=1265417 RepID=A0AAV8YHK0_9CUCU|nr:hypothetical protein NQ318_011232 [Aromia moschata]
MRDYKKHQLKDRSQGNTRRGLSLLPPRTPLNPSLASLLKTIKQPQIFKQENYSTESEEENGKQEKKRKEFPKIDVQHTRSHTELSSGKDVITDLSYQSFHGFTDEDEKPTHNSLVTIDSKLDELQ